MVSCSKEQGDASVRPGYSEPSLWAPGKDLLIVALFTISQVHPHFSLFLFFLLRNDEVG